MNPSLARALRRAASIALVALTLSPRAGAAADPGGAAARRFGVRPVSVRVSGGGWLLDLRYRVVDPVKARALFEAGAKPKLVDRRTGATLHVPEDGKLGALRSSPRARPEAGKQYFVLFRNPDRAVKRGAHVDVQLGRCTLRDLVVE